MEKEEYLNRIKEAHKNELIRASKFYDMKKAFPVGSDVTVSNEKYLVTGSFPGYEITARRKRRSPDAGEYISLMNFDIEELS